MKYILFASLYLFIYSNTSAQQGLYKSAGDYKNGKLSYQSNTDETTIRPYLLFNKSAVKVKTSGESVRLQKSDVYGFRNARNQDFRFYDNGSYRILDPTHFHLYSRQETVLRGKAKSREMRYYFSRDAASSVMLLTKTNLKNAFPGNREFHDLLDLQFRSDKDLVSFDSFYKEYKLKSIFGKLAGR